MMPAGCVRAGDTVTVRQQVNDLGSTARNTWRPGTGATVRSVTFTAEQDADILVVLCCLTGRDDQGGKVTLTVDVNHLVEVVATNEEKALQAEVDRLLGVLDECERHCTDADQRRREVPVA